MPFELVRSGDGWKVRDDKGKTYSEEPLSRRAARAQMRALYANDPAADRQKESAPTEEEKETVSAIPTGVNATGRGGLTGTLGLSKGKPWGKRRKEAGDRVDEVYAKYHATVNMSAGELERWAENEWSRLASLDRSPIERNLRLLKKPKGQWTADDVRDANRTINFVNRMRGMPKGKPVRKGVPYSKRDISLMNWAYRPKEAQQAKASFTVFKDKNGSYRWVLQSSNAYRDRDGEYVSIKALINDVDRSEKEAGGDYGPLRWWHMDDPAVDLGRCDWRIIHGRTLIESGTFLTETIGKAVKEAADQLQVSIGFNHPPDEPDKDGVFHTIRVFERSLLPRGKAANQFTRVMVKGDDPMASKKEKLAALETLGIDPQAILAQAEATEKEADENGVTYKEADAAAEEEAAKAKRQPEKDEEEEDPEDDEPVIGNMSVKEYKAMMVEAMKEAFSPIAEKMHSHDAAATKKEADERTALKDKQDAQDVLIQEQAKTIKQLAAEVAELRGEAPRAVKDAFRASQADETVISDEQLQAMKEAGQLPTVDPVVDGFLGSFLGLK